MHFASNVACVVGVIWSQSSVVVFSLILYMQTVAPTVCVKNAPVLKVRNTRHAQHHHRLH